MFEYVVKEVNKVVDGDTIDITIDLGFALTTKQRVRMNGVDTPESITKDAYEKTFGIEAKEFIQSWFLANKSVKVRTEKDDKYGRILGHFYAEGDVESLNEKLVRLGYAWEYDGGTKKKDFQQLIERRNQVRTAMV